MDATLSSKIVSRITHAASPAFPAIVAMILVVAPCGAALTYAPDSVSVAGYYFGLSVDSTPVAAAGASHRPTALIYFAPPTQAKSGGSATCRPDNTSPVSSRAMSAMPSYQTIAGVRHATC